MIGNDRWPIRPLARPRNGGDVGRGLIAFAGMSGWGKPQLFAQAGDVGFNLALGEPAVKLVLGEQGFEIVQEGIGRVFAFGLGPDQTLDGGLYLGPAPGDPALVQPDDFGLILPLATPGVGREPGPQGGGLANAAGDAVEGAAEARPLVRGLRGHGVFLDLQRQLEPTLKEKGQPLLLLARNVPSRWVVGQFEFRGRRLLRRTAPRPQRSR